MIMVKLEALITESNQRLDKTIARIERKMDIWVDEIRKELMKLAQQLGIDWVPQNSNGAGSSLSQSKEEEKVQVCIKELDVYEDTDKEFFGSYDELNNYILVDTFDHENLSAENIVSSCMEKPNKSDTTAEEQEEKNLLGVEKSNNVVELNCLAEALGNKKVCEEEEQKVVNYTQQKQGLRVGIMTLALRNEEVLEKRTLEIDSMSEDSIVVDNDNQGILVKVGELENEVEEGIKLFGLSLISKTGVG